MYPYYTPPPYNYYPPPPPPPMPPPYYGWYGQPPAPPAPLPLPMMDTVALPASSSPREKALAALATLEKLPPDILESMASRQRQLQNNASPTPSSLPIPGNMGGPGDMQAMAAQMGLAPDALTPEAAARLGGKYITPEQRKIGEMKLKQINQMLSKMGLPKDAGPKTIEDLERLEAVAQQKFGGGMPPGLPPGLPPELGGAPAMISDPGNPMGNPLGQPHTEGGLDGSPAAALNLPHGGPTPADYRAFLKNNDTALRRAGQGLLSDPRRNENRGGILKWLTYAAIGVLGLSLLRGKGLSSLFGDAKSQWQSLKKPGALKK